MKKAIAFGIGMIAGASADTAIILLALRNGKGNLAALLAIPLIVLLLITGALIGREICRHGAYAKGYRQGYEAAKNMTRE